LNKLKFHSGIESLKISKVKFGSGILLGLSYSFVFYFILYMSRESVRLFSISDDFNLWIYTGEEVNFYNFFLAYLSLLFGQSVCIQFWAERSRKFLSNYKERLTTIINDQRVLMWYFLSWFSKLAFVFSFVFVVSLEGGSVFSFYQGYKFIFILFLIALFLQSWVTIRKVFKRNSFKWMGISFVIISILALGISRINIIDYKEFNNTILNKNICYKYNIEIPKVNIAKNLTSPYLIRKIYFAKSDTSNFPILVFDNNLIKIDSLAYLINEMENLISNPRIRNRLKYQLYIDQEIQMKFIKELTNELGKAEIFKFAYSALPRKLDYEKYYYRNHSINHYSPNPIFELNEGYENQNPKINLDILGQKRILIDNRTTNTDSLKRMLKVKIEQGKNYELNIQFKESCRFDSYINVLSLTKEAINELRNEYSLNKYNSEYEYLQIRDKHEVMKRYNLIIIDSMESKFKSKSTSANTVDNDNAD
jgi:hypothetical protein